MITIATTVDEPLARLFEQGGEMGRLMAETNWALTPVGPAETWPTALRNSLGLLLGSASQLVLLWGPEFTQFYNDAFRPILGASKHPAALGQRAAECWSEVWDVIHPMYAQVMAGGATSIREGLLLLQRNGFLEECYFDYTYSPVRDERANVAGILAICSEVTDRVLSVRRLRLLSSLRAGSLEHRTAAQAALVITEALAEASADIPFALTYLFEEDENELRLVGASGIEPGSVAAPSRIRLDVHDSWPLGSALEAEQEVDLGQLPFGASLPGGAWAEAPRRALLLPLSNEAGGRQRGVLVLGVSPRLVLDAPYRDFLRLLSRDVASVVGQASAAEAARRDRALAEAQRARLYRHFMQAPFPIAVFRGPRHVIELANPDTLRAWGKGPEVVGMALVEAIPELRDQAFLGWLDDVYRTGVAHEGREELARLPGGPGGAMDELYFNFVYAPLRDDAGVVEGILLSAFVVTDQVRARQALQAALTRAERSEAHLRDFVERTAALSADLEFTTQRLGAAQRAARIGIFDWDVVAQRMHWSPELFGLMGLEPGALEPSPEAWLSVLFHEDRERAVQATAEATRSQARTFEIEARLRLPAGGTRWVRLTTEVAYADAIPRRLLGAVVDIEELKEAAVVRELALREAERIGRVKDEFLATMSHELRTPLNAMLGWSKMLRTQRIDEQQREHALAVIERNAEAQGRLIDDLLDVSRIMSGKLLLMIDRVELGGVVLAALDVVKPAAESKRVSLVSEIDPALGALAGDADRLQQIVWNLVSNGVKFTPAGGTVTVRAERHESTVLLRVADTGAGLSPDNLRLIFERFQQVDSSTSRSHGGLGLGLAIVRHLVEAHGGSVRAESKGLGHGSAFIVSLPVHAVIGPKNVRNRCATRVDSSRPQASDEVARRLARARILVIDDDADSRELLSVLLETEGARVTTAPSAERALELTAAHEYDLIVSDIGMPGQDGYELMAALRARGITSPAVALTAYARQEDIQRAHYAGFQQHSSKPVDAEDLIQALGRLRVEGERAR